MFRLMLSILSSMLLISLAFTIVGLTSNRWFQIDGEKEANETEPNSIQIGLWFMCPPNNTDNCVRLDSHLKWNDINQSQALYLLGLFFLSTSLFISVYVRIRSRNLIKSEHQPNSNFSISSSFAISTYPAANLSGDESTSYNDEHHRTQLIRATLRRCLIGLEVILIADFVSRSLSVYLLRRFLLNSVLINEDGLLFRYELPFLLVLSSIVASAFMSFVLLVGLVSRRFWKDGSEGENSSSSLMMITSTSSSSSSSDIGTLRPVFVLNDGRLRYGNKYVSRTGSVNPEITISNYYDLKRNHSIAKDSDLSNRSDLNMSFIRGSIRSVKNLSKRFPAVVFRRKSLRERITRDREKISTNQNKKSLEENEHNELRKSSIKGVRQTGSTRRHSMLRAFFVLPDSSSSSSSSTLSTTNFQKLIIREKIIKPTTPSTCVN